MTDMWFVLLTIILAKPVTDGGPEKIGDVLKSSLVAASDTESGCQSAGNILAAKLTEIGGGSVVVVADCVLLPANIGDAQGF